MQMPLLSASATSHGKDVDYVFQKQIIDTLKRYDAVETQNGIMPEYKIYGISSREAFSVESLKNCHNRRSAQEMVGSFPLCLQRLDNYLTGML